MSEDQVIYQGSLRPGDVLLYYRHSVVGRLIRLFDSADVSHAALYTGQEVAEAVGEGLLRRSLQESLGHNVQDRIFVHRWGGAGVGQAPVGVVQTAQGYLAKKVKYSHSNVLLAAFLSLTRKIPLPKKGRLLTRLVLDRAAAELSKIGHSETIHLMCSEFVYRCYGETSAESGGPYQIRIAGVNAPALEGRGRGTLLDNAQEHWSEVQSLSPLESTGRGEALPSVSDDELEQALDDYERSRTVEASPVLEPDPIGADPALGQAVRRFARALLESGSGTESALEKQVSLAPSFERFSNIVSSFVSPGDLRKSPSLGSGQTPGYGSLGALEVGIPGGDAELGLLRALETNERAAACRASSRLAAQIRATSTLFPPDRAKDIMQGLRRKRLFSEMLEVGEALVQQQDVKVPPIVEPVVRRQYAQALIEKGQLSAALSLLEAVLPFCAAGSGDRDEVQGLIGRVHKQRYVGISSTDNAFRAGSLRAGIAAYLDVYRPWPDSATWHGINVVALAARAERDSIALDPPIDWRQMARDILATPALASSEHSDEWTLATKAEAELALGQFDQALATFKQQTALASVDAFECASALRQLEEIWQLREDGPGGALVSLLRVERLRREGGQVDLQVGGLQKALDGMERNRPALERVYGSADIYDAGWLRRGLDNARAVARVEDGVGRGVGTGFLLRASDLFDPPPPELAGELVFMTNAHVIGLTESDALRPSDAIIRFDALGDLERTLRVKELLFESPVGDLDTTIVRLDAVLPGLEPFPVAPAEPPVVDGRSTPRHLYILGHPDGGRLALSLEASIQVGWTDPYLHYRTPTRPGSSGSPVTDNQWRVIGIHHAGADTTRRPANQPAVEGNEGVWIHAIRTRLRQTAVTVRSGGSVSKARLREGVFLGYSHKDEQWLQRVQATLTPLMRGESLRLWNDRMLGSEASWAAEIEKAVESARVAVLLVTPSFLASEFIAREELPRILEAHQTAGLTVLWIAVSASSYQLVPALKARPAANDPDRPLDQLSPADCDQTLVAIGKKIQAAADLSRVKNVLSVADQMGLRAAGMGGTRETISEFSVVARQVSTAQSTRINISRRGVEAVDTCIDAEELATLTAAEQQLVGAYEEAMRRAYKEYVKVYPDQQSGSEPKRRAARRKIERLQRDMCAELGNILKFLGRKGKHLDAHYAHVRVLCTGAPDAGVQD